MCDRSSSPTAVYVCVMPFAHFSINIMFHLIQSASRSEHHVTNRNDKHHVTNSHTFTLAYSHAMLPNKQTCNVKHIAKTNKKRNEKISICRMHSNPSSISTIVILWHVRVRLNAITFSLSLSLSFSCKKKKLHTVARTLILASLCWRCSEENGTDYHYDDRDRNSKYSTICSVFFSFSGSYKWPKIALDTKQPNLMNVRICVSLLTFFFTIYTIETKVEAPSIFALYLKKMNIVGLSPCESFESVSFERQQKILTVNYDFRAILI